jgi:hypothetical protein
MKSLITTLAALLISTSTFAMELSCVTEFPTTSVYGEEQGDEFVVMVYHHNGTGYLPLHNGIITPNDLPVMQERAQIFESLGQLYEFRYPLSECQRIDKDIMTCSKGKETVINGVKVRPWSLYTMRIDSEMDIAKFEETQVSFLMDIEGKTQHMSMKYMRNECFQQKKAQKIFSVLR